MSQDTQTQFVEHDNSAAPLVLISYSHDSDEHKNWVRELATRLRQLGVDVLLDQWELGLGDDIPKFMERGVSNSKRVLMVCTEAYNRKADDGKGGVGYEAMIVTGELVADLGTRKFIPITRQSAETKVLPKCLSTRYYIDFSKDNSFEEKLEELARELHSAQVFKKPELGTNPFTTKSDQASPSVAISNEEVLDNNHSPLETYETALNLAKNNDFAEWTKFVHKHKNAAEVALCAWRKNNEANTPKVSKDLPSFFCSAVEIYNHLFAIILAAIDSDNERFKNQLSLIDWIREPKGWIRSGYTIWVDLPDLVLSTFQAIIGSFTLHRQQPKLAYNLATTQISERYHSHEKDHLFLNYRITGWVESLGGNCKETDTFLKKYFNSQSWLQTIFGGSDLLMGAYGAYYSFLNILDFFSASKEGLLKSDRDRDSKNRDLPRTPLFPAKIVDEYQHVATSLIAINNEFLHEIMEQNNITSSDMESDWKKWLKHCYHWIHQVYTPHARMLLPHADLPKLLKQSSGDLNIL
ncbi:toll/interleukin-1 receptor domain-containing protein [Rubritalea spongiae]|uniref:Toll/interleukin-1 receptor domain-containing protein n=1 Tax=Rubritalea spongiae TaxID=430797 RepID=A0ABW5E3C3_9BACT